MGDRLELTRVRGCLTRQHRELVPAQPCHQTVRPDRLGQPRAKVAQQLVTVVMAEGVVDLLEAVEVEEHHAELLVSGVRGGDPLVQPGAEALAVREAGELVGGGDAVKLFAALL